MRGIASFCFLVVGLAGAPLVAAPLDTELANLVGEHPLIKSNKAQVSSADAGVRATLSPFLPSLDVSGGYGYENVSLPAFRASPDGPLSTDAHNWSVTLRENLYDGGRKFANRDGAKISRTAAEATLANVRQTVLLEGATAYINVLRQLQLVELSDQNEDNIRKQLNLEDERVRRGSGIAVDVLQAKSRLQVSLERLVAYRGALQDAQSRYLDTFGRPPDVATMTLPPQLDSRLPKTLDEAIAIAVDVNPNVLAASKRIDLAKSQKRSIEAEYQPSIDLVTQAKYERDFNGAPGIRRDRSAKVQVTWNLFSGLGTQSRARQVAHDYEARSQDLIDLKRRTEEQTRLTWQALQTALERVDLLENAVNISAEVFEARKKLREAGKESVINVLDAENEVYSARINYVSALHDARIAAYQLLFAIGQLELENVSGS